MQLKDILFSQGFGTRQACSALIASGAVTIDGQCCQDEAQVFDIDGLSLTVGSETWAFHAKAYLMLNKPAGYECSTRPGRHPGVLSLLPLPLRQRGVQPVGRLDVDTTGLLLLTDDGPWLHRLTSPKHHVHKVYEVRTKHLVAPASVERLRQGVVLRDDPKPARAVDCVLMDPRCLHLTLDEGRYHQVKRMIAAVNNRVESLHRIAVGSCVLPPDLQPGQWRWIQHSVT